MGWFFINIILPITVPFLFLLAAKFAELPEPYASRTKIIRAVQDGQLGWVALVFAAACSYELLERIRIEKESAPSWAEPVLAIAYFFLALSGFLATLGTLYPVDVTKPIPKGKKVWARHYRMFLGTAFATFTTAALFSLVHYTIPTACKNDAVAVDCKKGD